MFPPSMSSSTQCIRALNTYKYKPTAEDIKYQEQSAQKTYSKTYPVIYPPRQVSKHTLSMLPFHFRSPSNHSGISRVGIHGLSREDTVASGRVLNQWALTPRKVGSTRRHGGAHALSRLWVRFAISWALHQSEAVARALGSHHAVCQRFPRHHTRSSNAAQSRTRALAKFLHKLSGIQTRRWRRSPGGTGTVTLRRVPLRRKYTIRGAHASEHITSATAISLQRVRVKVDGIGFGAEFGRVHVVQSRVTGTVTSRHQLAVLHHCVQTHLARRRAGRRKAASARLGS